jgi:putative oxidoreductase
MTTTQKPQNWLTLLFRSNLDSNLAFQLVWTVLRVIAGVLMIHNGMAKLADVEGFASYVVAQTMGLPFPTLLTYCAAYTEIIGAVLLMLGLLTRPAAIALLFTMGMAVYFHLREKGFVIASFETATLYATCYLFCAINGGGWFSLDSLIAKKLEENKS